MNASPGIAEFGYAALTELAGRLSAHADAAVTAAVVADLRMAAEALSRMADLELAVDAVAADLVTDPPRYKDPAAAAALALREALATARHGTAADILERLRDPYSDDPSDRFEAADEIEKLRQVAAEYAEAMDAVGKLRARKVELWEALSRTVEAVDNPQAAATFQLAACHGLKYTGPSVDAAKVRELLAREAEP